MGNIPLIAIQYGIFALSCLVTMVYAYYKVGFNNLNATKVMVFISAPVISLTLSGAVCTIINVSWYLFTGIPYPGKTMESIDAFMFYGVAAIFIVNMLGIFSWHYALTNDILGK